MKKIIFSFIVVFIGILTTNKATAGEPTCHSHPSASYCNYTGYVDGLYVNTHNLILIYFDTPLDATNATAAGFTGTISIQAAAIVINDNPEFAKLFYSTALSAQAQKKQVTIQMRGKYGDYLKADRIWLADQ